jgi:hypothetical protein
MTTVVIYGCLDPMTNELRYVGKTNIKEGKTVEYSLKRRLAQHCRNSGRSYRECWFQSLLRKGVKPVIVAINEVDTSIWQETEKFWIDYFKLLGCRLVNTTDGGRGIEGFRFNTESKLKLAKISKERQNKPEAKIRTSKQAILRWQDPDYRKIMSSNTVVNKRVAGIRVSRLRPEYLIKVSVARKRAWKENPQYWFTDGIEERRFGKNDIPSKGWIRGRLQKRTDAAKHSTSLTLKEFYSNPESRLAHSERMRIWWDKRRSISTSD